MDPRAVRIEYAQFLRDHPDVTLESIFSQSYDQGFRPAGALLCQMVFERGGTSAVKALLASGLSDDDLKAGLGRLLGKSWADIQTEWRRRALAPR
jgi:hypothetical protein